MDSRRSLSSEQIAVLRAEVAAMVAFLLVSLRSYGPFRNTFLAGYLERAMEAFLAMEAGDPHPVQLMMTQAQELGKVAAQSHWKLEDVAQACMKGGCASVKGLMAVAKREGWPTESTALPFDRAVDLFERLTAAVVSGYTAEQARSQRSAEELRRDFFDAIAHMQDPPLPEDRLAEMASQFGYTIPGVATILAFYRKAGAPAPDLGPDVLVGRQENVQFVVLPGDPPADEIERRRQELGADRLAVGLPVSLNEAGGSMRWARQALESDIPGPLVFCKDISRTLHILGDKRLARIEMRLGLGRLASESPEMQEKYMSLLVAMVDTGGSLGRVADSAGIHRNTLTTWRLALRDVLGRDYLDRANYSDLEYLIWCWRACGSPLPLPAAPPPKRLPPAQPPAPADGEVAS